MEYTLKDLGIHFDGNVEGNEQQGFEYNWPSATGTALFANGDSINFFVMDSKGLVTSAQNFAELRFEVFLDNADFGQKLNTKLSDEELDELRQEIESEVAVEQIKGELLVLSAKL
jgi:hypothetical protein